MNEIKLFQKKIIIDKSPVIMKYDKDDNWLDLFDACCGEWSFDGEWIVGKERGNRSADLFTKEYFEDNVMMTCTIKTGLPATRDVNAVFCARWDEEKNDEGPGYLAGLNGWWEHKAGIEKYGSNDFMVSLSPTYQYEPGKEIKMTVGAVNGHCFMVVDGELISELLDPNPLIGGHVGFAAYCTVLMIKDVEVRKIYWEKFEQSYEPEF